METRQEFLERTLTTTNDLINTVGSPQNQAFVALEVNFPDVGEPTDGIDVQRKLSEIYALHTLYYALNGTGWKERWATGVSGEDICDGWKGVVCDETTGAVRELNLTANDLMGELPSEIKGLWELGKWHRWGLHA